MSSQGKVGRNDPCPCGSGRKYKHCCGPRAGNNVIDASAVFGLKRDLDDMVAHFEEYEKDPHKAGMSMMESLGRPNSATEVLHQMQDYLAGMELNGKEDLERALEGFSQNYNETAQGDFLGLSPRQIRVMMGDSPRDFERWIEVGWGVRPEDSASVPILKRSVFLLRRMMEGGPMKLTQAGYLPVPFVNEWYSWAFADEGGEKRTLRSQSAYAPMGLIIEICDRAGLLDQAEEARMGISRKGRELLDPGHIQALYRELFWAYLESLLDLNDDAENYIPDVARGLPIFFWNALRKRGQGGLGVEELEAILTKAFSLGAEDPIFVYFVVISGCFIPAELLGFIPRIDPHEGLSATIRSLEFMDRAIRWRA